MPHELGELKAKYPNVDEFLLKKWDRAFGLFFDRNMSDDITAADFYIVIRQARNIYGAQSEQAKYAKDAMTKLWEGLKKECDFNHDEKISIEEWVDVLKDTDRTKEDPWFHDYMGFLFKLFDVSGDAVLDMAEYTDGMHCYGFAEGECHEAFNSFAPKAKPGHPAVVNRKQFADLWLDYFFSKDRAAPGNNLFGMLPKDF